MQSLKSCTYEGTIDFFDASNPARDVSSDHLHAKGGATPTTQIVATTTMTRGKYYRLKATATNQAQFEDVVTTGAKFGYLAAPNTLTLTSVTGTSGVIAGTIKTGGATETPAGTLALYKTTEATTTPVTTTIVAAAGAALACTNLAFPAAVSNTSTLPTTAKITDGSASGNYFLVFTPTAGIYAATSTPIYSSIVTAS